MKKRVQFVFLIAALLGLFLVLWGCGDISVLTALKNLENDKAITALSIVSPAATGTITGTSIAVTVPYGTNVTALVASFATTGASVKVGSTVQISGVTANNFTNPITYTVIAANFSTQDYVVTVTIAPQGSSWTARTLPSSAGWQSVTYGNGVFVAVATGGGTAAATSPDGITWTAGTLPSSAPWQSVTYGNGVFVAVAGDSLLGGSTAAATSP